MCVREHLTTTQPILQIALPVPLRRLFDYLPGNPGQAIALGSRVVVPFGNRKLVGIVVSGSENSNVPANRLLRIAEVLDQGEPVLDESLLNLMKWCWAYYKHAPGDVLLAAVPPALRASRGRIPKAPIQFRLTENGEQRLAEPAGRAVAQHNLLAALADGPFSPEQLSVQLSDQGVRWRPTLQRLLQQGLVIEEPLDQDRLPGSPGPSLTGEQELALQSIRATAEGFSVHLVDGVTGSGKTEIYLNLLEQVLGSGQQALVLVPEIGLTPQLIRRFHLRLGLAPSVLHSGLSAGQRLSAWQEARSGRARLVIGTRSALFTPLPSLGLIILDEEHDASFKQQDGFRYSARDVAVKRAADLGIRIVMGSATPSLESLNNAAMGRYHHHRLRKRATRAALPDWRVLDMRQQTAEQGLTHAALEAIDQTIQRGEQAMVFLNRRGYAPVLMCGHCGWNAKCNRCESNMTWHRSQRRLSCHHCGSEKPVPRFCPECRADGLVGIGEGTQQLESGLAKNFPDVPVLRFDRDSTSGKGVFENQLEQVRKGEPCILVGTQMLAKGHHFPSVTLVVVVNADQALYSSDYRALERLGQTLLQVAGRAGRAEKPGTVMLQTYQPESEALHLLITKGYEPYANWLLEDRRLAGLPPVSYQAMLKAEHTRKEQVIEFLQEAKKCFPRGVSQLLGPVPALMEKVAGRYRMYLLAQSESRPKLHGQLDQWVELLENLPSARKVRWAIDVDPQEM